MAETYSVEVCKKLEEKIEQFGLYRPKRLTRYEPGTELCYEITGVEKNQKAKVRLLIEKFIGGGYAGQVYKVKIINIETNGPVINGLDVGGTYAMKILVPPSGSSKLFRDLLYWVGFQGPFQLQVNPEAAMAGALWQKFIKRAAKIRFGDENAVNNIHAIFVDYTLGSCGEISDWVEGRTWRLEVDNKMDFLKLWQKKKKVDTALLGSPEYRTKKNFMKDFVKLLHDMGAYEFARQYEWTTCKSQPNCLKFKSTNGIPEKGLVAVDFRAGLTLLPFLPMSPGDFKLILQGIGRGSVVQFDQGNIRKLDDFIKAGGADFSDMMGMLEELKKCEQIYRNSLPDITHNHIRLLYSGKLWSTITNSAVTGWRTRNLVDSNWDNKFRKNKFLAILFFLVGVIPLFGKVFRRIWARPDWRKHYGAIFTSGTYLRKAMMARITERLIKWHRKGRISEQKAVAMAESPLLFVLHLLLSLITFAGLHRFLTDAKYAKEKLHYIFVRPIKLYFNAELREQWLHEMVAEGKKKHILSDDDAQIILSHLKDPFIQKYLKSLVVHLMTLPVTQIVSVSLAIIYLWTHPEVSRKEAWAVAVGILAFFQIIPISPGSLVRGLYVVYMVKKDRDFKSYNIAVFLGFFKYIGYLAFPIQMTYQYPALARFMASHWATEAVHIVPVFGEQGALLEHWIFRLFYNWPLTIRRRMQKIAEIRKNLKPRYWHIGLTAIAGGIIYSLIDFYYLKNTGHLGGVKQIWAVAGLLPMLCGAITTIGCGGAERGKRVIAAAICGLAVGLFYTLAIIAIIFYLDISLGKTVLGFFMRTFVFAVFSTIGALIAEIRMPDPGLKEF